MLTDIRALPAADKLFGDTLQHHNVSVEIAYENTKHVT